VYSCSSSERKELLARLGWREVIQALDDPALVVAGELLFRLSQGA